jgi:hypothetical protein
VSKQLALRIIVCSLIGLYSLSSPSFAGKISGGTRISGEVTAQGKSTEIRNYQWSVTKTNSPDQVPFIIPIGTTEYATFTVTGTRTGPLLETEVEPAEGQACISNEGRMRTEGLRLLARLQILNSGAWQTIEQQNLPIHSQIRAGRIACFDFSFDSALEPYRNYRVVGIASISNWIGYQGTRRSTAFSTDLRIFKSTREIDATARISDALTCPTGLSCNPIVQTWFIDDTSVIAVDVAMTNDSVPCSQSLTAINRATIIASDSEKTQTAAATIQINTGSCSGLSDIH